MGYFKNKALKMYGILFKKMQVINFVGRLIREGEQRISWFLCHVPPLLTFDFLKNSSNTVSHNSFNYNPSLYCSLINVVVKRLGCKTF